MRNIQPIEKRVRNPEGFLSVHSIFKTIQGEGPFCGTPCVFVRLAGCNLQCPACDTDYTSGRQSMNRYEILYKVNELWRRDRYRPGLIVITGGEPFRQELSDLFDVLLRAGYYIQVETNGTLAPPARQYSLHPEKREGVYIVCSPKTGKLNSELLSAACALKYVVKHGDIADDGLPLTALDHPANPYPARPPQWWDRPVYVQPLDSKNTAENQRNTQVAVKSCLEHGYILQLQIHKYIGVE